MYQTAPSLVLGFHGCDSAVGEKLISGDYDFKASTNPYDWLGNGMYFWENSEQRAMEWAQGSFSRGKIKEPCVVGAVIDLGLCLNLLEHHHLTILQQTYLSMVQTMEKAGNRLPVNKPGLGTDKDNLLRHLDCAVINFLHAKRDQEKEHPFDSVRGVFFEGDDLYPNAGFKEKNHMQLAVRNPNCIKGFFRPRKQDDNYARP